jgi:gliding motility-associated-like protein
MKTIKPLLILMYMMAGLCAQAIHIKGGWMYYEYLGKNAQNNNNEYRVVVKLYRDCAPPTAGQNDAQINIAVYKNTGNSFYENFPAPQVKAYRLEKKSFSECINPKPSVCYVVLEYATTVSLPPAAGGYTASFQRCCRINGIVNVVNPSNTYGNTYTITLPGNDAAGMEINTSPVFAEKDTVAVCYNSDIQLDYSATDFDHDSLVYSFTSALTGASQDDPNPPRSTAPPYPSLPYAPGYSAINPFGTDLVINPQTGLITGKSPSTTGEYVLGVLVKEYRNGVFIAQTRKELHVNVAACSIVAATLPIRITSCDGYTVAFENLSTSPAINSYYWDFGVKNSIQDTSTQPKPTYVYPDTGVYIAKLVVNPNSACTDSAVSEVKVYPGFFPAFTYTGSCFANPFQFQDQSTTRYGFINSQSWDFGNPNERGDTSHLKNPQYLYPAGIGTYSVYLKVTSNLGCEDTITKQIQVFDKPLIELPFKDTLICSIDSLMLKAIGDGNFSWAPTNRMINSNSATPVVFPLQTTTYTVTLNDRGCIASDTVRVNVLDFITVNAGNDTTICRNDAIILNPVSQGLQYQWTPSTGLSDPTARNPLASPQASSTTYTITVNLGKCQASDNITIRTVPYPIAMAGNDTSICPNDTIILKGSSFGASVLWSPASLVEFPANRITPAYPGSTTAFIYKVFENLGCPKPGIDTIIVTVVPPLQVFAGNDTSIVVGQPLQLNGLTNGSVFLWTPSTGMSNPGIANPVVVLNQNSIPGGADNIRYVFNVSTPEGCISSDDIVVTLFKTAPSIFVPNAFTPNQDGKNDVIRPVLAGMKQLFYFRVYNRYGQVVFETKQPGSGWDGKINGITQSSNAYVYTCEAEDFTGKVVKKSGTFVLVR